MQPLPLDRFFGRYRDFEYSPGKISAIAATDDRDVEVDRGVAGDGLMAHGHSTRPEYCLKKLE